MEIHWQGQLTERDLQRAYGLYYRMPSISWALGILLLPPLIAIVGALLYLGLTRPDQAAGFIADQPPVLLFLVVVAASFFLSLWWPLASAAVTFRRRSAVRLLAAGTFTPTGLTCRTAQTEEELEWQVFQQYRRSKDIVVLYHNAATFRMFPHSFFATDADWQAFNELVAQHVSPNAVTQAATSGRRGVSIAVFVVLIIVAIAALLVNLGEGLWR